MAVFTDSLSSQFQTLAPDLRGYGRSRTHSPFQMANHLDDLIELLDQRRISQCLVLGWSLGGILAMELALRHPDRVCGLILVATAARPRGSHPPITWQDNLTTLLASLLNRAAPGHPWIISTLGRRSLYRYLIRQHTSYAYRQLATTALPAYLRTSRHAHQALRTALQSRYDCLSQLPQLTIPCLMLCGAEDRHITATTSMETAQRLPHCDVHCYPDVAHLFPWEIPQELLADIYDWLNARFPTCS